MGSSNYPQCNAGHLIPAHVTWKMFYKDKWCNFNLKWYNAHYVKNMANVWEKAKSILAGNSNSGSSTLVVPELVFGSCEQGKFDGKKINIWFPFPLFRNNLKLSCILSIITLNVVGLWPKLWSTVEMTLLLWLFWVYIFSNFSYNPNIFFQFEL